MYVHVRIYMRGLTCCNIVSAIRCLLAAPLYDACMICMKQYVSSFMGSTYYGLLTFIFHADHLWELYYCIVGQVSLTETPLGDVYAPQLDGLEVLMSWA